MKKILKYVCLLLVSLCVFGLTRKIYLEVGLQYYFVDFERACYVVWGILFAVLCWDIAGKIRPIWGKGLFVSSISFLYVIIVFLTNNYWKYLEYVECYHGDEQNLYKILLRGDALYSRGYGEFRYPMVVLAMVAICATGLILKHYIIKKAKH